MKRFFFKNDNYIIIPFWITIFLIFWLQVMPQTESLLESLLFPLSLVAIIFFPTTYLSKNLLMKAMRKRKVKMFIFQFLLSSIFIGFSFAALLFLFSQLEKKGIFPVSTYFNIEVPRYVVAVLFSAGVFINLCMCGLRFLLEYIKSQKTILEYQLRTLQHQVSPHFMFNVLNHIHILMQKNVDLASELLVKYSDILRYQLYSAREEFVTLNMEIQFLKDVIGVEKMRWGDELNVSCYWHIADGEKRIQPLLLIAFVENAFKHVSRSISDKGYINITVRQEANSLFLEVENSKPTQQIKKKEASGLGLANARERLNILYPDKHKLLIDETDLVYIIRLNITL